MSLLGMSLAGLTAGDAPWQLFLGQVQHGLNGAAEVHQAKGHVVNITAKHIRRKVLLEGEQGHRWEIVKDYDGQDDEDHFEGSLLHRVHLISTGPGLPQRPENGNVAEDHEGKRCEDHRREDLLKVDDLVYTFGSSVGQSDQPHHHGQHCSVLTVLELSEGDGVDHSHVPVQADAGEEERRGVFHAVEEAKDVPGAGGGGEEDNVGQLQRRDEAEEHV